MMATMSKQTSSCICRNGFQKDLKPDELLENVESSKNGRTYMDVPDIDGVIYIKGKAKPNTFVNCKVTGYKEYDLIGEIMQKMQR